MGVGSDFQRGMQAATVALQGLAGGDIAQAAAGAAAPYLAQLIKQQTPEGPSRVMAHALVQGALAAAQNKNAMVSATGELVGMLATELYHKEASQLTEGEKETVSTLATLAAGLAGGLTGADGTDVLASAQTGKTVVENNGLSLPPGFVNYGQTASTLGQFMAQNGTSPAEINQAQSDLAKGLATGAPQPATELVKTWALLMSTVATRGTGTIVGTGAIATGATIGGASNISVQVTLNADKPFSYTDAFIAIGAGALT